LPKRKIVGKLPVLRRADIRQADHQLKMGRRIPGTLFINFKAGFIRLLLFEFDKQVMEQIQIWET